MNWLSDKLGTFAEHRPSIGDLQNQASSQADANVSPIIAALQKQYAANADPLRRSTLGSFASRGFGLSGMADEGIAGALAQNQTAMQKSISDAQYKAQQDAQANAQQQYQNQNAEKAGKRDKFLGIF